MRILTSALPSNTYSLISILEADEDIPQNIVFCIPINYFDAKNIRTLNDFRKYFDSGISTRISNNGRIRTIKLNYTHKSSFSLPKFTTNISGHEIDFNLSSLNFKDKNPNENFLFDFYYEGNKFRDLRDKKFVILEVNWKQLDKLAMWSKIALF